jgi:hypothetical protein
VDAEQLKAWASEVTNELATAYKAERDAEEEIKVAG